MTNAEAIVFNELLESLGGMVDAMSSDLHDLMLAKLRAIEAIKAAKGLSDEPK